MSKKKQYFCNMKQKEEAFAPMWDLNPLWNTLTDEQKKELEAKVELIHYAKNEIIHNDGDESNYVCMGCRTKSTFENLGKCCK